MTPDNDGEDHDIQKFGWWPEIVGAVGVALLIWFLTTFARGSL